MKKLKNLHEQLSKDIDFMNLWSTIHYNKGHADRPTLKRGEKVFLLQQNIKTKWPSQKLDHQKIGSFKIEEKLGPVNY